MLCNILVGKMPVGKSGRIVIEIDPDLKKELYQVLKKDNSHLKDWFLANVEKYLEGKEQLQLDFINSQLTAKEGGNAP